MEIWEEFEVAVIWPCIAMHELDKPFVLRAFRSCRSSSLEVESQFLAFP